MKKVVLVASVILILFAFFLGGFYVWGLKEKSADDSLVTFVIEPGTSKTTIAKNLENAGLIRSAYALDVYLFLTGPKVQAGEYEISPNMTPKEMIEKFRNGDVKIHSLTVTFIEGKRITDYSTMLAEKFLFTSDEFLSVANDTEYLTSLIQSGKYWFLTDAILNPNIYYPLEGYLYPDTYEFLETATPKDIIETLLNHTLNKLEPLKDALTKGDKSVHEYLTMASIVEKEANSSEDRARASQVFYSRLSSNMSLGSDVTAFYGARKEMGKDSETWDVLNGKNLYNTRLTDGSMNGKLPIGPIANPSITSIASAVHPSNTNYFYFVANVCTGEVFFQENYQEFITKVRELQSICEQN